jgi:hypothetical protein
MRERKKLFMKSDNNLTHLIQFRVTPEEKAYLSQNAGDACITLSEYLMRAATGKRITSNVECNMIVQASRLTMDLKRLAVGTGMHLETGAHHETYKALLRKLSDVIGKAYDRRGKFSSRESS